MRHSEIAGSHVAQFSIHHSAVVGRALMRGEFVDIGGVRVYCYAFGSRGVGEPIVLIHGCFLSSHLWQDVLPRLPKGHRVLVLDLLGHGRSDPPGRASMTVAAHAARLAQLLDVMGVPSASLVGHGAGAAVAARVAQQFPARVAHLALVNPSLLGATPQDSVVSARIDRVAALVPLWRRLSAGWVSSALHSALLPSYAHRDNGARSLDLYLRTFRTREGRDAACAQLQALRASRSDSAAALSPGAIACPVTLAIGSLDRWLTNARIERLVTALNAATSDHLTVERMSGVAHVAPEEAPDRLGTLVAELLAR